MLITLTGKAQKPFVGFLAPWHLPGLTPAPFDTSAVMKSAAEEWLEWLRSEEPTALG